MIRLSVDLLLHDTAFVQYSIAFDYVSSKINSVDAMCLVFVYCDRFVAQVRAFRK